MDFRKITKIAKNAFNNKTVIFVILSVFVLFYVKYCNFDKLPRIRITRNNKREKMMDLGKNNSENDFVMSHGLYFVNKNIPGYYIINNGEYCNGMIEDGDIKNVIDASVKHDLDNQYNINMVRPHLHSGKARGYINIDRPTCRCGN